MLLCEIQRAQHSSCVCAWFIKSLVLLISIIFLTAGLIQGISGFGSALIAMPLLTLFIDVKTAVPLCILHSVLMTSFLSFKLRDHMEKSKILPLFTGSLPGIYMGVTFLKNVDTDVIKFLLGLLIASYSLFSLAVHPKPRHMHKVWAYLAGFGTGFIGSAFSAGGPPAIIYTTLTGWSKDHIKATLTGFFLASAIATAVVHAARGLTNAMVLRYFLYSSAFAFVGVITGSYFYTRISRDIYVRIILIILLLLGVMMMITGLRR